MSDLCPFRDQCSRMGGICQCAEQDQAFLEAQSRSELGEDYEHE